jgi:hypothetical protein
MTPEVQAGIDNQAAMTLELIARATSHWYAQCGDEVCPYCGAGLPNLLVPESISS